MTADTSTIRQFFDRYFALATATDPVEYLSQFDEDVVVVDDGRELHGLDAVRDWHSSVSRVRYVVRQVAGEPDETMSAMVDVLGDFPGSPVTLLFRLRLEARRRIRSLAIRPVTAAERLASACADGAAPGAEAAQ